MTGVTALNLRGGCHSLEMYHIFYDLEVRFHSLIDCTTYFTDLAVVNPSLPYSAGVDEDKVTLRVSAAPTIVDCIAGIIPDIRFKRCIASNDLNNQNEVYPIVVVKLLSDSWVKPTAEQVPDIADHNEYWSLTPCKVVSRELLWLGYDSLRMEFDDERNCDVCVSVRPVSTIGKSHPWLNGKGHPLLCSDTGDMEWPLPSRFLSHIYIETFMGRKVCFVVPELPSSGYGICMPLDGTKPYRARLHNCFKFSGFVDKSGNPVFENTFCLVPNVGFAEAHCVDGYRWMFDGIQFENLVLSNGVLDVDVQYKELSSEEWRSILGKAGVK